MTDSIFHPTKEWSGTALQLQLAEEERDRILEMAVQAREALPRFKVLLRRLGVDERVLAEASGVLERELLDQEEP